MRYYTLEWNTCQTKWNAYNIAFAHLCYSVYNGMSKQQYAAWNAKEEIWRKRLKLSIA